MRDFIFCYSLCNSVLSVILLKQMEWNECRPGWTGGFSVYLKTAYDWWRVMKVEESCRWQKQTMRSFCDQYWWYLSRQISIRWIIMWRAILGRYMCKKTTNLAELKTALQQYGMICHRSSMIRQPCDFERDFDFVLLQLADTLNTQFKYWEGSWHSLLKRLKCWRKSFAKFDSLLSKTYWIFRTWLHVHLKKNEL